MGFITTNQRKEIDENHQDTRSQRQTKNHMHLSRGKIRMAPADFFASAELKIIIRSFDNAVRLQVSRWERVVLRIRIPTNSCCPGPSARFVVEASGPRS